jgi:hypothetical protein
VLPITKFFLQDFQSLGPGWESPAGSFLVPLHGPNKFPLVVRVNTVIAIKMLSDARNGIKEFTDRDFVPFPWHGQPPCSFGVLPIPKIR